MAEVRRLARIGDAECDKLGEHHGRYPAPAPVLSRRIRWKGFVLKVQKNISSRLIHLGVVAQYVELGE